MFQFPFPSQLIVLLGEDGEPVNLIYTTPQKTWVREDGQWVEFVADEENPKRQYEGMEMAPVGPELIDLWDKGGVTEDTVGEYEFVYSETSTVEDGT